MSRTSVENLSDLRRWATHVRTQAAVEAVKDGQPIIEDGLKRRCPVGATRRLINSIYSTKVGVGRDFVGGFVMIGTRYAGFVEARRPFIGPTARREGPRAAAAMLDTLRRLI